MEHECEGDTSYNWYARYCYQRTGTETGGLGNKRTSGDHRNCTIIKICQNIEKSPGDVRRIAVIHNERPSVDANVENSQRS